MSYSRRHTGWLLGVPRAAKSTPATVGARLGAMSCKGTQGARGDLDRVAYRRVFSPASCLKTWGTTGSWDTVAHDAYFRTLLAEWPLIRPLAPEPLALVRQHVLLALRPGS